MTKCKRICSDVNGTAVQRVREIKYLGVQMDSELKLTMYSEHNQNKLVKYIYCLFLESQVTTLCNCFSKAPSDPKTIS